MTPSVDHITKNIPMSKYARFVDLCCRKIKKFRNNINQEWDTEDVLFVEVEGIELFIAVFTEEIFAGNFAIGPTQLNEM